MILIVMKIAHYFLEKKKAVFIYINHVAVLRNYCYKSELVILPLYTDIEIKVKNPIFDSGGLIVFGQERG